MFSNDIYTALNVSSVTALPGDYTPSIKALFSDTVIPSDCAALSTINFYQTAPIDNRLSYGQGAYTVNCRAQNQNEAETIALAVVAAVNRRGITDNLIYCQLGAPIPPQDETDVYNVPVEITIKKRI